MSRMDNSLAGNPSVGVMPVDKPTVPNALTTSNRASTSGTVGSASMKSSVPTSTTSSPINVMTAALRKASIGRE